jgi:hypothetical protein
VTPSGSGGRRPTAPKLVRALAVLLLATISAGVVPACGDSGGTTEPDDSSTSTTAKPTEGATIPDISGPAGKCLTSAATFLGLQLLALSGEDKARDAAAQVAKLKTELPDSLHDEVDLVATTFAALADKGVRAGADQLQDPRVKAAIAAIAAEITRTCGS